MGGVKRVVRENGFFVGYNTDGGGVVVCVKGKEGDYGGFGNSFWNF